MKLPEGGAPESGRKKIRRREVQWKQKFRMKESATAHRAAPVYYQSYSLSTWKSFKVSLNGA